jgi:glycerate-2-kinase
MTLIAALRLEESALGEKLLAAAQLRSRTLMGAVQLRHENKVLADSELLLHHVVVHARRAGYDVIEMGSRVQGEVGHVAHEWGEELKSFRHASNRLCVVGTGEVTVEVRGTGRGGRCQELAWRMAEELSHFERDAVFVASSSDGRDFIEGVGGAWVDTGTLTRAKSRGIDWHSIVSDNDSFRALDSLHQLLPGAHTGWNLCDIYLAML